MRIPSRIVPVWLVVLALVIAVPALAAVVQTSGAAPTKLLRYPDIHGDRVVFCYAADLWWAPAAGGNAVRLTSHPGIEQFPKYSPDGKWIAFTGQYDGDEQVYVIPADGGVPRQLTFYPARGPLTPRNGWDNQVMGWTRDSRYVLFNTLRDAGGAARRNLYTVPVEGGHEAPLPMYTAGAGDYSPDGKRMVYSPLFHDFRTWKRYEGGWAQDLYLCDLKTLATENITNNPRSDRDPMWIGERIYFTSDRDGTLNLYRYDLGNKRTEQITHSTTWDVRWPSTDHQSRIVYETDGELHVFQIAGAALQGGDAAAKDTKISISVPTDGVAMRPSHYPVEKFIEDFTLAPHGERALFVAHGDIFTAPIENGPTRNLTHSTGAHDKWARWSPDGKQVAFISDRTGEEQVWVVGQDGTDEPRQLTTDMKVMLYAPAWSPDSKSLAFSDKNGNLYVLALADKRVRLVTRETRGLLNDYAWSPGGSYLAFTLSHPSGFNSVRIWSAADNSLHQVTSEMFNSSQPQWDPEGNYLYFFSDHEYAPQQSRKEANYASSRNTGIFAMALRKDVKHPFPPKSDEVSAGDAGETHDGDKMAEKGGRGGAGDRGKEGDAKDAKDAKPARPASKPITIDFDGIDGRVAQVPVTSENYGGLAVTKGNLMYIRFPAGFNGRDSYAKPALVLYSIKDREESVISDNASDYAVSDDGSKVLVLESGKYNLYDAKPKVKDKKTVPTKDLYVDRVPSQEWAEIFEETWRRYRDWFYVGNMNGYDWKAIHDQYKSLLPYVAHRWDLTYVLNEMISELNNSHLYIEGGDMETPVRPVSALPGARFSVDEAGRYRIAKIFRGQNEEEKYRSPLTEVGVNAKVGDYVLAIDGQELKSGDNLYQRLRDKKDPVTLTLNDKPTLAGAHKTTYKPVTTEANLIYLDWVAGNFDKVTKATDGRVGYLHIPDMGPAGIAEFIKWYYPQIRKEGLVVDVRSNGGGNVSQTIIERLNRKLLGTQFGRVRDDAGTYPSTVFTGPMVCLVNETSASDGDIFPYMFQKTGLGPLIGKRTWGGVVGISGRGPLLDGGNAFVPQSGLASPEGKWVIEGHGVDPDIVVENDPASFAAGHDLQLERGVEEVQKLMKTKIAKLPGRPPDPVKTQAAMEARVGQKTP